MLVLISEESVRLNLSPETIDRALSIVLCAAIFAGCSNGAGAAAPAPQLQARDLTTRSTRGNVRFAIGIKPKVKTRVSDDRQAGRDRFDADSAGFRPEPYRGFGAL